LLQQTYSPRFNDYAIEFYSFVADNYAPFYSTVIECTDRDAAFVLDGLLYNESDLALEEHYTDTHGYTEINFAAFAMLGRRFAPRIRGLKKQRIYRIDKEKEYCSLTPLVDRWDRTIHLDWICEQWDRMGQFYASLESGHVTASTALKRLAAYSGKNHFYRGYLPYSTLLAKSNWRSQKSKWRDTCRFRPFAHQPTSNPFQINRGRCC
jgi:TnpA family transposase